MMNTSAKRFDLGRLVLQSGEILPNAFLAYKTYGQLNDTKDNVVIMPTFYTGTHARNEGFFGTGRALDPARHFIVCVNMLGNGLSSSPSNTTAPYDGPRFPKITLWDNIRCQHLLLTQHLGVQRIALVLGWSMAGCQAYQWAVQYPDMVDAILPFCASAKTSVHNTVFLEGVKAALTADAAWNDGNYTMPPERGLRAFARVYAGWAFSQTFYREHGYRRLGFDSVEALLQDWENDHLQHWDANNLLAKLYTWQAADISSNELYNGDFPAALAAIRARAILLACSTDLYFPPEDNAIEVQHMPKARLSIFESDWGHCVASPGNVPAFERTLDNCIAELLGNG